MDCNTLKKTVAELSTKYEEQQKYIKEIEQQIKDKQQEIEREEQILKDCEGARAQQPNNEMEPQVIEKPKDELTIQEAKDNLREFLRVSKLPGKLQGKYYGAVGRPSKTNVRSKLLNGWESVQVYPLVNLMRVKADDNRKGINFNHQIYILPATTQDQVLFIFNNKIETLTADANKVIMAEDAKTKKGGKKNKTYKRNPGVKNKRL